MKTLQQTTPRQALITVTSSAGQADIIVPLAVAQFILFVICNQTIKTLIVFTNYILDGANLIWLSLKIWGRMWLTQPFQKKTRKVFETFRVWGGCIQIFLSVIFLPLPKGV